MSAGSADESPLAARLAARIRAEGPIPVSEYVDAALYDPDHGFFMIGGRAGRAGDFITAPEVGFLFGAVMARAIDSWWIDLGRPSRLLVIDVGAGPGTLGRSVLEARPEVAARGALEWGSWEPSSLQRTLHPHHEVAFSTDEMPPAGVPTVFIANEVLDNRPFDMVERTPGGWAEILVDVDQDGVFTTVVGGSVTDDLLPSDVRVGCRVPWQTGARALVAEAIAAAPAGRLVVLDYGADTVELAARPDLGWLRTHRGHEPGGDWLRDPGTKDVTTDVAIDQIIADRRPVSLVSQATFLRRHGIEELVDEGRRIWEERAHLGDLEALLARSRISEAEALLDPGGMGGFFVAEWPI